MKTCTKCKVEKSLSEFYKRSDQPGRYMSHCRSCLATSAKAYLPKRTAKKFGISIEQYEQMFIDQNGLCAICDLPEPSRALAVDHDHSCCAGNFSCGECVRALLCSRCNVMIGMSRDSTTTLLAAIDYLGRW